MEMAKKIMLGLLVIGLALIGAATASEKEKQTEILLKLSGIDKLRSTGHSPKLVRRRELISRYPPMFFGLQP